MGPLTRRSEDDDDRPLLRGEHSEEGTEFRVDRVLFSLDDDEDDDDTPLALSRYPDQATPDNTDEVSRYHLGPPLKSTIQSREAGKEAHIFFRAHDHFIAHYHIQNSIWIQTRLKRHQR